MPLSKLPDVADRLILSGLQLRGYKSRRVATSVGRVHLIEARGRGKLPPLVVLHGLSASGPYYESLLSRVRPSVSRVIAPDMPGHGRSELPAGGLCHETLGAGLMEALDEVLEEPAVVFGNSLGAAAAVRYASERSERVLGLVLAAPGGAPMESAELTHFLEGFRLKSHGQALDFVDRLFHRRHPLRHVLAWGVRQQFGRTGVDDLLRSITPEDFLRPDELGSLRMPTLVLWGEADRILWPTHRAFFEDNLPTHAILERLSTFGHAPHIDQPAALAKRVLRFMAALPSG